jgi:glycosyltransferase involved in cell wall biosynthesis
VRVALTHAYCWPEVRRGGERLLHELAGALSRRDHDVTIISSARRPGRTVEDGVRVVRLRSPRGEGLRQELRFGRTVAPSLLAGRYDVVHSLGVADAATSIVAARAHRGRRTVFTHLGIPIREWFEGRPDWRRQRFVAEHVDVYGCLSEHAAATFEAGFGRRASRTPGGVRLSRFAPAERRTPRPTLLYSGVLDEPRKRLADLLEAVAILARTEPDVRLWLSGPGDPTALLARAPTEARVRTALLPLGTPDLAPVYGQAWATVLPSTHEAFGLVLVESLACGTPIVAADHAALPELVAPGVGALAAPEDPAALAVACAEAIELARDPATVERCREQAVPFDWDTGIAPAVEALYEGG